MKRLAKGYWRLANKSRIYFGLLIILPVTFFAYNAYARFLMDRDVAPVLPEEVVNITEPDGGETYIQGQVYTISWLGGFHSVIVKLVTSDTNTDYQPQDQQYLGNIPIEIELNPNNPQRLFPNGNFRWDFKRYCKYTVDFGSCTDIPPGKYKIMIISEVQLKDGSVGSYIVSSSNNKSGKYNKNVFKGNWDVSGEFTVVAPQ